MQLQGFMNAFFQIMAEIGMPVVVEKTLGPTQILEYLGLVLNFVQQVVAIPEKKRKKFGKIQTILDAQDNSKTNTTGSRIAKLYLSGNTGWQAFLGVSVQINTDASRH